MPKLSILSDLQAMHVVMRDFRKRREDLAPLIDRRLRDVLTAAYRGVPFYRHAMQAVGYNPLHDYRGPTDLQNLPVLTKRMLREHGVPSFVQEGVDLTRYFRDATSGSTGQPLQVWRSPMARSLQVARWLRVLVSNGYKFTDKVLSFTSPARLSEGKSILRHIGLFRRQPVNYLLPPTELLDAVIEYGPQVIYGNRSQIDLVASEVLRRGLKLSSLKLVVVGAEVVRAHHRRTYQMAYDVPVVEFYGSVELGVMAFQPPGSSTLEIAEDLIHFEFLNERGEPAGPGERCRAVMTDLSNDVMPFLRYDQGDWMELAPASASDARGWRHIRNIEGREDDCAILPDGSRVPFHPFYEVMDRYLAVRQFRVVQKERDAFEVTVAADQDYFVSISDELKGNLMQQFPQGIRFDVHRVEAIGPDPTGKLRMLISEVVQ